MKTIHTRKSDTDGYGRLATMGYNPNTPTLKYFIYARKSSEGDDRQITSIEDQVEECLKIAKRLNVEVVDIISEAKSAKKPERKGFNKMMERIERGEADGVITWKLNRIARNPVDGGNFIWKLQNGIIKHVQTISQGFYPKDNLVIMYIEFGMSSQYSTDLSASTARGTAKKAKRGWYPCPVLPVGYLHNDKKEISKGSPEIIKEEKQFKIVQSLFLKLLKERIGIRALKKYADAKGLVNSKGKTYAESSFYRLLRNEFYCGYFTWKNEEGILQRYEGKHTPMISPREFRKAQRILESRAFSTPHNTKNIALYGNIFKCGECSCKYTLNVVNRAYCKTCKYKFSIHNKTECPKCNTNIKHKEQFTFLHKQYYRCTKKRKKCTQPYISVEELEKQIVSYLETLTIDTKIYEWCINHLEQQEMKGCDRYKEQKLSKQIKQLESKLKGYTDMRSENELSKEEYLSYSKPLKADIETLKIEHENIHYQAINWKQELEQSLNFTQNLKETFIDGDYQTKRKILLTIGTNPIILDKKAHFITPKHVLRVGELVQSSQTKKGWNEPRKSLVSQGDSCGISLPF